MQGEFEGKTRILVTVKEVGDQKQLDFVGTGTAKANWSEPAQATRSRRRRALRKLVRLDYPKKPRPSSLGFSFETLARETSGHRSQQGIFVQRPPGLG